MVITFVEKKQSCLIYIYYSSRNIAIFFLRISENRMKVYAKESTKLAPIKNGIELPHFFVSMYNTFVNYLPFSL